MNSNIELAVLEICCSLLKLNKQRIGTILNEFKVLNYFIWSVVDICTLPMDLY